MFENEINLFSLQIMFKSNSRSLSQKIYPSNFLSLGQPYDQIHNKVWSDQVQEQLNVRQKKQIDKILHSLIKQRMFGKVYAEKSRSNIESYSSFDTFTINQKKSVNSLTNSRNSYLSQKICLKAYKQEGNMFKRNQNSSEKQFKIKSKAKTLQIQLSRCTSENKSIVNPENINKLTLSPPQTKQLTHLRLQILNQAFNKLKPRKISLKAQQPSEALLIQKQFYSKQMNTLPQTFRQLSDNFSTAIIYQIKLNREKLIRKMEKYIPGRISQRLLNFFNFPHIINYKQYCNILTSIRQTQNKHINFLIFSILDQSRNGFLTLSDLFILMQNFPQNLKIERQILLLQNKIKLCSDKLKDDRNKYVKLSVQQILVTNHKINILELKQLLKTQKAQKTKSSLFPRVVPYNRSVLILQHSENARQKRKQIQDSERKKLKDKTQSSSRLTEQQKYDKQGLLSDRQYRMKGMVLCQGLRFSQFNSIYEHRKPELFYLLMCGLLDREYQ